MSRALRQQLVFAIGFLAKKLDCRHFFVYVNAHLTLDKNVNTSLKVRLINLINKRLVDFCLSKSFVFT